MTIEDTIAGLASAWNAGDADQWAQLFTDDATFIDSVGHVRRGRELVAEAHRRWFDSLFNGSRISITVADRTELSAGVTLVHLESVITMPAPTTGTMRTVATAVFTGAAIADYHSSIQADVGDLSQTLTFRTAAQ